MANKSNSAKNFFDTMIETQQQVVDTIVDNTKKFANGNTILSEAIDKGTDLYKKTVSATKENFEKVSGTANTAQEEVKNNTEKFNEFFGNWYKQTNEWNKQMVDMNQNFLKSFSGNNAFNMPNFMSNPFQNPYQQMFSNFNQNNWSNAFTPDKIRENMDQATEQVKAFWNQFQNILNTNYAEFSKNFQDGTLRDSFKGMFNTTEGFSKFYEMWMPMLKSVNDKTFNLDFFSKNLDMSKYKEFVDSMFSFMPKGSTDYLNNLKGMYTGAFQQNREQMKDMFSTMQNSMQQVMPSWFNNPFNGMLNQYNNAYSQMTAAASPFAKLMTPTQDTKTMAEWNEIMNQVNVYNIKNAELQFMIYQNSAKVMEQIAENVMHKIENGEEISSMLKLYQEWLNVSDKTFVELFETDEYSKLMAEVSSLQMRIKKAVEKQMEKSFANVPVATRSEMDEVYQIIYDLKKEVRQLQSMLELENEPVSNVKKSASKKK